MSEQQPRYIEQTFSAPQLLAIFITEEMGDSMTSQESIRAIAGVGLEGDRYAKHIGAFSEERIGKKGRIPDDDRQVTLISLPGIEQANQALRNYGNEPFDPSETRRNLLVSMPADDLNSLVGKTFRVGDVEMMGVEECEPCTRPAILAGRKQDGRAFQYAFEGRGGLRAKILNDGEIHVGDNMITENNKEIMIDE